MQRNAQKWLSPGAVVWMLVVAALASPTLAQEPAILDGTIRFSDDARQSNTRCTIVNTLGEELYVRQCDRRLILARSIFSGNSLSVQDNNRDELTDFQVGTDFRVTDTRTSTRAGRIVFETDFNGLRTVFWVADESFPSVGGVSVQGGVLSYDRVNRSVTAVVTNVSGTGQRALLPSDLGFDITAGGGGREGLFLPCGADETIIDVDARGEPVLGCDLISGTLPVCGTVGSPFFLGLTFLAGLGIVRRSGTR